MSARHGVVGWNRDKLVYDAVVLAGVGLYLGVYLTIGGTADGLTLPPDGATLRMQAFGSCAFLLLTATLAIGPLARLDERFLPLLRNRRHLGVITCAVALSHAFQVLGWYYAFSPHDPWAAVLGADTSYGRAVGFPFAILGLLALLILLALAATSHDFWLGFLGPPAWKAIHMSVYVAYAAVVLHVALGAMQATRSPALAVVMVASVTALGTLHLVAGGRERRRDAAAVGAGDWVPAGPASAIVEGRGITVPMPGGDRVAVFRHGGRLSAVANACAHQNGPLGEGRIEGGCITCPWHGFQFRPADGCAPPPFTDKLATYRLRLDGTNVLVDRRANPPGTYVEPLEIPA